MQLDVGGTNLRREARLLEIAWVGVDADDARRAAALHLQRVESGVAADVEHGLAGEISRNCVREAAPLHSRIIAEEMVGGGAHATEVEILKPVAQLMDAPA